MERLQIVNKKFQLPDGREIEVETGKLAKQAHGSVVVKMGQTMLLATVVSSEEVLGDIDFMPLTVDYRERFSAVGRFPGGFIKREGRPSNDEILIMRLVDRALRPLFPEDYHADTQVMVNLLSGQADTPPDALACFAAAAALAVSDIPFNGPVSEVRVAKINGTLCINPSFTALKNATLDMIVAGTATSIIMVEGEMDEISEEEMLEAIEFAHQTIAAQCLFLKDFAAALPSGAPQKRQYEHEKHDETLRAAMQDFLFEPIVNIAKNQKAKKERTSAIKALKEDFIATLTPEEAEEKAFLIGLYFDDIQKKAVRATMFATERRLDGRKTDEIRPIWSEIDYLPSTHGSAIFTRGETQALMSLTLGSKADEQEVDTALLAYKERFSLHYNFPPFSTGEVKPLRGVGRREIGHGNLAQRALKGIIPSDIPYTIKLVCDILESNGSSSMATVCSGTLALMDGGVQIKAPVSGIAMGLMLDEKTGKYLILSDILGDEDHLGDMDFKVTGTAKGITACQMDIKIGGLTFDILKNALIQAKAGRAHILQEMLKTLDQPRADYKAHAPRIIQFEVPSDTIGAIIGPAGKIIQEIQSKTSTVIVIEENENKTKGLVAISGTNAAGVTEAERWVRNIAYPPKPEEGKTYHGTVKSIVAFGAFIEILPSIECLLHISEYDYKRIETLDGLLKVGDKLDVQVLGIDPKTKKWRISRKVLLPKPEGYQEKPPRQEPVKKGQTPQNTTE